MWGGDPPRPPLGPSGPPQGPPLSPQTGWGLLKVFFFSLSLWSGSTGVMLGGTTTHRDTRGGGVTVPCHLLGERKGR